MGLFFLGAAAPLAVGGLLAGVWIAVIELSGTKRRGPTPGAAEPVYVEAERWLAQQARRRDLPGRHADPQA